MTEHPIVEVVLFRVKDGITDVEFLQQGAMVQGWVEHQPGFISRELLKTPDHQWLDTLRWTSLELAEKAAEEILNDDHCTPFLNMIDDASIQMWHFEPQRLPEYSSFKG
jgi:hypothetical protein